jgi:hypothetical protein
MDKQKPQKNGIVIAIVVFALFGGLWAIMQMLLNPFGSGSGDFQSYRGPVLPMTSLNGVEGVDVDRNVDFDFSPYQKGKDYSTLGKGAAGITDTYVLRNTTNEPKTLDLVYGFQGQFIDYPEEFPTITVNGTEIIPATYATLDTNRLVWNAENFDEYSRILEENDFLSIALQKPDELNIPVTAYHFTDLEYNGTEVLDYPMFTLRFEADEETTIWTYIADEFGTEEDGKQRMMFRVDRGEVWVFTVGGVINELECGGNRDYNVTESSAIDGVTYNLETYETSLTDVIYDFAQVYDFWAIEGQDTYPNSGVMTPELLAAGAIKRIQANDFGETTLTIKLIDALFHDVITEPCMMYHLFPVELGPSSSVTVQASFVQEPSLDISGSQEYREGYELATKLGSDLTFIELTSSLSNTESIQLGNQNFGFDLEKGITEVTLDLLEERYYLEVWVKD